MSYLNPALVSAAISTVKMDPNWTDAIKIARRNTSYRVHLVGGQLYRRIVTILHGDVPIPPGTDFDFLVMGKVNKVWLPPRKRVSKYTTVRASGSNWKWRTKSSYESEDGDIWTYHNSATAVHRRTGLKVDLISILDVTPISKTKTGREQDYFEAVPLDIQAVAWDLDKKRLLGHGVSAIQDRVLSWNNLPNLNPHYNPRDYIQQKAESLGFRVKAGKTAQIKHKCVCPTDHRFLWDGCKCGGN